MRILILTFIIFKLSNTFSHSQTIINSLNESKKLFTFSIYLLLKLFYYKLQNRYIDGQYKETMRLIRELKAQNEEILKNNQLIMDENIRLKNKK
jgi:hypothetical protein